MNDHGFVVCAYNRTVEKVDRFLANEAKGKKPSLPLQALAHLPTTRSFVMTFFCFVSFHAGTKIVGAHSIKEMVAKLKKPRRVMMLVKAGPAVDAFIDQLVPLLEKGDIIIDGGNSEYTDSIVSV